MLEMAPGLDRYRPVQTGANERCTKEVKSFMKIHQHPSEAGGAQPNHKPFRRSRKRKNVFGRLLGAVVRIVEAFEPLVVRLVRQTLGGGL